MPRSLRLFTVALSLAVPALLSAQSAARPVSFGLSGGVSLPSGDLGDAADAGYVIAGHVYYKPTTIQALRFRGDVSFDRWAIKNTLAGADASTRNVGIVANALYDFAGNGTSPVKPYLLAGLGLYNNKTSSAASSDGGGSTDIGIQVGGGMEYQLSGFATFVEAKYVNTFSGSGVSWIPLSFGVRF
ncbi:outer membrane beta-barrel protein [Gemmatimonas groenlandica]|uniref:Outer membrane beta-barrel protein n=1 Tax=Gemmatimonas groenlandica TaxID=2732249 RepID=A0A6M4IT17_9BACT|nr:outer membrane beta-barrel protein [Gemmatimonas groenlandica]QJR36677.1 outer membrane beta-barrel protein [Gemmatimonas groenlandica]